MLVINTARLSYLLDTKIMIIILKPDTDKDSTEYSRLLEYLNNLPNITVRMHEVIGAQQRLTEIYLVGDTLSIDADNIKNGAKQTHS